MTDAEVGARPWRWRGPTRLRVAAHCRSGESVLMALREMAWR